MVTLTALAFIVGCIVCVAVVIGVGIYMARAAANRDDIPFNGIYCNYNEETMLTKPLIDPRAVHGGRIDETARWKRLELMILALQERIEKLELARPAKKDKAAA